YRDAAVGALGLRPTQSLKISKIRGAIDHSNVRSLTVLVHEPSSSSSSFIGLLPCCGGFVARAQSREASSECRADSRPGGHRLSQARRLARRLACRVTWQGCLASTRTTLGAPPTP